MQTELSATLGVSQDQTLIKVNGFDAYNQADTGEISKPLTNSATDADHTPIVYGISAYDSNSMKSSNPDSGIYEADTTRTLDNNGGNPACNQGGMIVLEGNGARPSHRGNGYVEGETMYTLNGTEHHAVCVEIDQEKVGTQVAKGPGAVCTAVVRRLTPMECERLQGFPDGWTDIGEWIDSKGKKHKDADSPRYKALGNSIALPFWEWMAVRMRAYLSYPCTMASLFDGIGGFPLVF